MTTMFAAARPVTRQAVRLYSRTAVAPEPKLHKAVGNWEAIIASKRPIDEDETHVSSTVLVLYVP